MLSKNNLPSSTESSLVSVCDACQQAKCHQLPYPTSSSVSKAPLELIFSDVWVLLMSVLEEINTMSALLMTLVSLPGSIFLRTNLTFFEKFKEFQTLVEQLFDKKILVVQIDWGGEL
jgi:hypothetical protein